MVPGVAGSVLAEARTAPVVRFWSVYLTGELTISSQTRAFNSPRERSDDGAATTGFDIDSGLWGSTGAWRWLSVGFELSRANALDVWASSLIASRHSTKRWRSTALGTTAFGHIRG